MNTVLPRLMTGAIALLLLAAFWLLSWLTVSTWLAREASERDVQWMQGVSPWQWTFTDHTGVVWPGSHGVEKTRITAEGLEVVIPEDGATDLSLALGDDVVALSAINSVRVILETDQPIRGYLLVRGKDAMTSWLETPLPAGQHDLSLPLAPLPFAVSPHLQWRMEGSPETHITLKQLQLLGEERTYRQAVPKAFFLPERFLHQRDKHRQTEPAIGWEAGGRFGQAGQWLETRLPKVSAPSLSALVGGMGGLLIWALWQRQQRRKPLPKWGGWLALGVAVVLLLAGFPSRDTPFSAGLALFLCLATWIAFSPASDPWQWWGTGKAWRQAMGFTALAIFITGLVAMLEPSSAFSRETTLHPLRYLLWAGLQQWVLMAVIVPSLHARFADTRWVILVSGAIFALLHTPNFILMVLTFIGGSAWAGLGIRHRALLPLVASHAVLGLWIINVWPVWLLRSAEIGGRYLMLP